MAQIAHGQAEFALVAHADIDAAGGLAEIQREVHVPPLVEFVALLFGKRFQHRGDVLARDDDVLAFARNRHQFAVQANRGRLAFDHMDVGAAAAVHQLHQRFK
ncbi:MAG: hypothetical protein BWZ10_01698 [candidate division BRC1 bacterium ADurb.BinA364]|nr:MAG: hypothetical protein BWZ10_01698 [candidate division BRC1 bacterium ADurb.BinA364]